MKGGGGGLGGGEGGGGARKLFKIIRVRTDVLSDLCSEQNNYVKNATFLLMGIP